MAKAAVLYRLDTLELDGAIMLSNDADLQYYPENRAVHDLIEVPLDHPVIYEQAMWKIEHGKLVKKDV